MNRPAGAADDRTHAATFGGAGFIARGGTHASDVAQGVLWYPGGVDSEVARLRAVLLAWPGSELEFADAPDRWLMLERIDLQRIRQETQAITDYFESQGVAVHRYVPPAVPPPNFIFMRDLFFMTVQGAVLARMGSQQRSGEERFAAHALATMGVPILGTLHGDATFEGADALWLDPTTVLLGVGGRTNLSALRQVRTLLRGFGVSVRAIPMPRGGQHLLGVVNFADVDLAIVHRDTVPAGLRRLLRERKIALLELDSSEERWRGRGMNFVTIGPRHVVMPAGCPVTRARFQAAGIRCDELRVDQYLRAAGALGCLTGIIRRTAVD